MTGDTGWPWLLYGCVVAVLVGGVAVLTVQTVSHRADGPAASVVPLRFSQNLTTAAYNDSFYDRAPRQILRATDGRVRTVANHTHRPGFDTDILIIGDSFTWGGGVRPTGTYPYRLAGMVSDRANRSITVVNRGLPGAGARDYLYLFNRSMELYEPDTVIVTFRPGEEVLSFRVRYALQRAARRSVDRRPDDNGSYRDVLRARTRRFLDERANRTMEEWYLDPIAERATDGCPQVIFYIYRAGIGAERQQYWRSWAAAHGVPLVSAPQALQQTRYHRSPSDAHYTAEGYRVLAAHLAERLPADTWRPRACPP